MATIRKWLDAAGFGWKRGTIIYQETDTEWGSLSPGSNKDIVSTRIVGNDDSILDYEFHSERGGPECPRFVAQDQYRIYFPVQYDGNTWLDSVGTNIAVYLDCNVPTPYPGG